MQRIWKRWKEIPNLYAQSVGAIRESAEKIFVCQMRAIRESPLQTKTARINRAVLVNQSIQSYALFFSLI